MPEIAENCLRHDILPSMNISTNYYRTYPAVAVMNGAIWVADGDGCKSLEKFDPKIGKWEKIGDMPEVRSHFNMVTMQMPVSYLARLSDNVNCD